MTQISVEWITVDFFVNFLHIEFKAVKIGPKITQ